MAKKTLLSEGNIRKFMKLAAIEPLTENFLAEAELEEEKMEEGEGMAEKKDPMGEAHCMEEEEMMAEADEPADDMPADDMPADEPMGDDEMPEMGADAEGEGAIKDALMALIDAIKGAPDAEITVDEAAEDMEEGMYKMEQEDMEEGMYEELNESVQVVDTGAMVKEVSRRVAQRLLKESKQEQLAEALAAKIAAKLG
tara:strand:+ start:450 stop:1043 length:594 start_codon:yes stop_codon:yes gene_type:complete